MLREERFKFLLETVNSGKPVNYPDVSERLNVSADTVRRDIEYLHQNGLLLKVRGGAVSRNRNPLNFQDRIDYEPAGKEVIAIKTQALLKKGMTLFMDGGTTICAVAERFAPDASFKVITNNLALVPILSNFKHIELIILGGLYNADTQTNVGAKTCQDAEQYIADLYLMGTCAVSPKFGITAALQEDGAVKKAMLKGAKKVAVLSNSTKIGASEFFKVCNLADINVFISELPADDRQLDEIRFLDVAIV